MEAIFKETYWYDPRCSSEDWEREDVDAIMEKLFF